MALQWLHSWGRQRGVPSLRPTAIWVVLSSMRNPSEGTGRAFSKAPDSFLPAAKRRINIILLCNVGYDRAQLACMCPKSISLQLQPELSCLLQKNLPFCLLHGCHPRQQYHLKQKLRKGQHNKLYIPIFCTSLAFLRYIVYTLAGKLGECTTER